MVGMWRGGGGKWRRFHHGEIWIPDLALWLGWRFSRSPFAFNFHSALFHLEADDCLFKFPRFDFLKCLKVKWLSRYYIKYCQWETETEKLSISEDATVGKQHDMMTLLRPFQKDRLLKISREPPWLFYEIKIPFWQSEDFILLRR